MSESKPQYVLCPGDVISKHDGTIHYVNEWKLAALYGVNLHECLVLRDSKRNRLRRHGEFIFLRPRYDGDYTMPVGVE